MTVEALLARLQGVARSGLGWKALCPAHADISPSLAIDARDGKILLHCHATCTPEAICAELGIEMRDLFLDSNSDWSDVAAYKYVDEEGMLLFEVLRRERLRNGRREKTFVQRRPDGKGGWIWGLGGMRRVLYRLAEVLATQSVLVVEGEKDVETARKFGLIATCNPGGARKWRDEFSEFLRGMQVSIIADADEPGRAHAQRVAASLADKATSLKVLELPGAKDLTEWIEKGGTQEQLLDFLKNTPEWNPRSVMGERLLDDISAYIRRFVSLSESQARVAAVWVVHTHALDAADSTPYLAITSAEKQSGKTRLLEVLLTLVANAWFTGRVTAAVLTRKIDVESPTLLLDESDAAFGGEKEYAEALRGVLNTGHRRGGAASCCVGQGTNLSFRDFSTYCAKAIAGIGKLPDTVADRAISIRLKRAAQGEKIERFRLRDVTREAANLKAQIEAWCDGIIPALRDARPELPDELTDRQQDGAEPLLAIADGAGGDWPRAIRQSLIELCAEGQAADSSIRVQLLADIWQIFDSRGVDRLSSADLVAALCDIETSPWAEWSHGKPITPGKLARLLSPHEIKPHSVRIGDKTPKGYQRNDFEDAWSRYLRTSSVRLSVPPRESATGATTFSSEQIEREQSATERTVVADQYSQKHTSNAPCGGVAFSGSRTKEKQVVEVDI